MPLPGADMVDRNAPADPIVIEQSPSSNSKLEKTQETDGDGHKTYCFHNYNCGTVNVESFGARNIAMANCGNQNPQTAYHPAPPSQSQAMLNDPLTSTNSFLTMPSQLHPAVNAMTNNDVPLQMNSTQPVHSNSQHHLERLLDSPLATIAVIQLSGNTLADVLTPRAYDTFKGICAISNIKSKVGDIPPPATRKIHISISIDCVMAFSWVGLVAISCLLFAIANMVKLF